jgi:sulfoxide reductase catalytic subunit YedY
LLHATGDPNRPAWAESALPAEADFREDVSEFGILFCTGGWAMSRSIRFATPPSSEITPEAVYMNRRSFLRTAGLIGSGAILAACGVRPTPGAASATEPVIDAATDELGDTLTSFDAITHYNNYYEFTTSKEAVAVRAADFRTRPWTVEVGGLVHKPKTYDVDELLGAFSQEERIYRLRCVEAWSMVIPWLGSSWAS